MCNVDRMFSGFFVIAIAPSESMNSGIGSSCLNPTSSITSRRNKQFLPVRFAATYSDSDVETVIKRCFSAAHFMAPPAMVMTDPEMDLRSYPFPLSASEYAVSVNFGSVCLALLYTIPVVTVPWRYLNICFTPFQCFCEGAPLN